MNAEKTAGRLRQARVPWFDGARGYLLTMMFVIHYCITVDSNVLWIHHGMYLPVMDGEFFVLVSGYVCALAYYGAYRQNGVVGSAKSVLSRLKWVYLYQVAVSIGMIFMFRFFGDTEVEPGYFADFNRPLIDQIIPIFQLRAMPPYLNILMLYIVLMAFIPLAFWALERGARWSYLAVVACIWFLPETIKLSGEVIKHDWAALIANRLDSQIPYRDFVGLKGYFHPLTYAALFYGAFYLGYISRKGVKIAEEGPSRLRPSLFYVCLGIMGLGFVLTVLWQLNINGVLDISWATRELAQPDRAKLSLQALITTFAASYMVWYLIERSGPLGLFEPVSMFVRRFFMLRELQLLGKNSLFVYSMHVPVMYMTAWFIVVSDLKSSEIAKAIGLVFGFAALVSLTWLKARFLPKLP